MTTHTVNPGVVVPAEGRASLPGGAGFAVAAIAIGALYLSTAISWRQAALSLQPMSVVTAFGPWAGLTLSLALLASRFKPGWKVSGRSLATAVLGGLLLGYGARLAYGCNIGAYFGGIASGSLHGWLWLVAAFAGNMAGTHLRPVFGLTVERTKAC